MTKKARVANKGPARKALAAQVTTALKTAGVDAVLVGGSVVSIYSNERYVTASPSRPSR
jgi:heptaprenylglyceryl phosphate synthase